jgi:drug/metabolite transporter (DMT)-like permease
LFFFSGLLYTSALNAALIVGLTPATTLIFSVWLLETKITQQQKIGIVIAFIGVIFLLTKGQPLALFYIQWSVGDLLILGANVVFALQNIWIKQYAGALDNTVFTYLTNALCFLGFVLLLPVVGIHAPPLQQFDFWLSAIGIGFLGSSLAYLFWNSGIQSLGAANGAIFINAVPLTTAIFSVFFGEQLEVYHAISGALILSGVLYVQLQRT